MSLTFEKLLDNSFPENQKKNAVKFLEKLYNDFGSLNHHVEDWFNSGNKITHEQIKTIQECKNIYMKCNLIIKYANPPF